MPNMANITVKKADGTTDITYTQLTASAGDAVPAQWRNEVSGAPNGAKPSLSAVSRFSGDKKSRRITLEFRYPYTVTDSTTGLVEVVAVIPVSVSAAIPQLGVPDTAVQEATAQAVNLFASTLIKDTLRYGYAPT